MDKLSKAQCQEYKVYFMEKNIITNSSFYEQIIKNKIIVKFMASQLSQRLSDNKIESIYGLGIISDFDLYHNLNYFTFTEHEMIIMKSQRNRLKRLINIIRIDMVHKMNLFGTSIY